MKKHKAAVKEQKKIAKKELTNQITSALQAVIANFTTSNKKIEKLLNKNAKQLVKKLSKEKLPNPAPIKPEIPKTSPVVVAKPVIKKVEKSKS